MMSGCKPEKQKGKKLQKKKTTRANILQNARINYVSAPKASQQNKYISAFLSPFCISLVRLSLVLMQAYAWSSRS
jgi:hypothetical protein